MMGSMRKGIWIVGAIAVVACVLLLWLARSKQGGLAPEQYDANSMEARLGVPPRSVTNGANSLQTNTPAQARSDRSPTVQAFENRYKTPIAFYGKVVDQNEKPIKDVTVELGTVDDSKDGYSKLQMLTDAEGQFSLSDAHGKTLTVKISKEGYYSSPTNIQNFEYFDSNSRNFHVPNQFDRVIFHIQKKGHGAQLIHIEKDIVVPRDGAPVGIDLSSGAKSIPGDLRIQFRSDRATTENNRYDWEYILDVPGGTLLVVTNELEFAAPDTGYVASDSVQMPRTSPDWQKRIAKRYFLKLANGNYARIQFRLMTGTTDFFVLDSYLNPNGTRNLEPAEKAQPKTPPQE